MVERLKDAFMGNDSMRGYDETMVTRQSCLSSKM